MTEEEDEVKGRESHAEEARPPKKTVYSTSFLEMRIAQLEMDIVMTAERLEGICRNRVTREAWEERYGRGVLEENFQQL